MPRSQSVIPVLLLAAAALATSGLSYALVHAAQDGGQAGAGIGKEGDAEKAMRELIKQLGDERFERREEAVKRLAAIGEPVLRLLEKEALESKDAEVRERADKLVQLIGQTRFQFISLLPKANLKLAESLGSGLQGNNLANLPTGKQNLARKTFQIENAVIHLSGTKTKNKPTKVDGIRVDKKLARLHILHGTCFGQGMPGDLYFVADDTLIGEYKIYYDDKTTATIPIVYGKDVRDWIDSSKNVTRGTVAWQGSNDFAGDSVRLYMASWDNPHPRKLITSIDYHSMDTLCSPFCVAMSAEPAEKESPKPAPPSK